MSGWALDLETSRRVALQQPARVRSTLARWIPRSEQKEAGFRSWVRVHRRVRLDTPRGLESVVGASFPRRTA